MKTVWIAAFAMTFVVPAAAQTTIYKLVDEGGRVTYSNKPMKGAVVMDLEPLTTIPGVSTAMVAKPTTSERSDALRAEARPAVAIAAVDRDVQKRRDEGRRKILETELGQEEKSLTDARNALASEQQNPQLIAAVRTAQQATEPTPAELLEYRKAIDKASSRIRGLQATVVDHEKNVEALRKELGALKP
jgi:hypothetical protein